MRFIVRDADAELTSPLGGKARALAALREAGLPIPPWFVVLPDAFHASLTPQQSTALQAARDGASLREVMESVCLSPEVQREVRDAVTSLCHTGELVAVRSSASDE